MYIGSHEEKLSARQHGFDLDFWAGSHSNRMTMHVEPRSSMLDPHQCATSPTPAGVETVSRKTFVRNELCRRVAEIEHDFNDDRDAWRGISEGARWTGVSVFRLAAAVTLRVARTFKGRATGTGHCKPHVQPNRPRDVTERHRSRWSWEKLWTQQNWSWQETKPKQEAWSWDTEPSKWSFKPRVVRVCRDCCAVVPRLKRPPLLNQHTPGTTVRARPALQQLGNTSRCQKGGTSLLTRCGRFSTAT